MIARLAMVTLLLTTAALLQTSLFPFLTLAGFRPDLLLLVTIVFALREGPGVGTRIGFVAGLAGDLLANQSPLGLGALVLLGIGYVVGIARPYLAADSVTAPILLAFAASLGGTAAYGTLSRLLGEDRFTMTLVLHASLFVALYNTLLAPAVIPAVTRLTARFPAEAAALIGADR